MKKTSMSVAQLRIAGAVMFAIISNPNAGNGMTPEILKKKVVALANAEYKKHNVPALPDASQFAWKTISRAAIQSCSALYPNVIANVQSFCKSNPLVTGWLYTTSSTISVGGSECNFFSLHLMTAITSRYVLSATGAKSSKIETINYLTKEIKNFFVGSGINVGTTITDEVLLHVATTTIGSIKLATPETLASYTKVAAWKPLVLDRLTAFSNTVYSDWTIVAAVPTSYKLEMARG